MLLKEIEMLRKYSNSNFLSYKALFKLMKCN